MASRGYTNLLDALTPDWGVMSQLSMETLCERCGRLFDLDGTSLTLEAAHGELAGMSSWGDLATRAEAEQFVLGEGPGITAAAEGRPALLPDLASDPRFPAFARAVAAIGLGAVFAFPLAVGAIRVGVLSMYRQEPGPLDGGDYGDALLAADITTWLILSDQGGKDGDGLSWAVDDLVGHRAVVHQATGMVSVQLGCSLEQALGRLRAYAFAHDLDFDEVASQVVDRRLRFDQDGWD
jgi:hypothetical protein